MLSRHLDAARAGDAAAGSAVAAGASGGGASGAVRSPVASDTITLDPRLADALYKGRGGKGGASDMASGSGGSVPTHLTWREASARFVSRLEAWVRLSGGGLEKPITKAGTEPPTLQISTAQRRGHMVKRP